MDKKYVFRKWLHAQRGRQVSIVYSDNSTVRQIEKAEIKMSLLDDVIAKFEKVMGNEDE